MTVNQISVFVENKPGMLAKCSRVLSDNGIDIRALSMSETLDFGILRMIVDDTYKAICALKEAGYVVSITPVIAVAIEDKPGSFTDILDLLGENEMNLEYTYAFISRKHNWAYMILRVDDNDKTAEILRENNVRLISQEELDFD